MEHRYLALSRSAPQGLCPPNGDNGDDTGDDHTPIEPAKRICEPVWLKLSTGPEAETAKRRDEDKNQCQCPSQNDSHGVSSQCISRLIRRVRVEIGKKQPDSGRVGPEKSRRITILFQFSVPLLLMGTFPSPDHSANRRRRFRSPLRSARSRLVTARR